MSTDPRDAPFMRSLVLVVALVASSCSSWTIPTQAHVARYEGPGLRYCTVSLGWTQDELLGSCGEPVARVERLGRDAHGCWIYETIARPITSYVAPETRFFGVCFGDKRMSRTPTLIVEEVIGLTTAPAVALTATATSS